MHCQFYCCCHVLLFAQLSIYFYGVYFRYAGKLFVSLAMYTQYIPILYSLCDIWHMWP